MATLTSILAELGARQQASGTPKGAAGTLQQILARGKDSSAGDLLLAAAAKKAAKDATGQDATAKATDAKPDPRTIKDTVTLTDDGQKIVNLNRGRELAQEFRTKPVDKDFFAALARAREDVFRIGRLFTETIKAAFAQSRK